MRSENSQRFGTKFARNDNYVMKYRINSSEL